MNSKRSYLDAINAGRQRRSYASLEDLNRSLDTLEQRLERNREEAAGYGNEAARRSPAPAHEAPRAHVRPQQPEYRANPEHQPYRSIARDIERMRKEEDGVAAFGKIAGELKGLREELRHQMASSMRREFDELRKDFQRVDAHGGNAAARLGRDVERLSGAMQSLGDRGDDHSINLLRLEIDQVKAALDTLAREETLRSVDRRWDDFDRRFNDFEDRVAGGPGGQFDVAALTDRIDQIGRAVGNLPESLSLRSLEEKVRTLGSALDRFIERQDGRAGQTFAQIEERLDEISRAIVGATVAAQHRQLDPEPFTRIEARISSLAKQIEEVAADRSGSQMMEHLQALSRRVDDLAARSATPDEAVERLAYQISVIADKVDHAPAIPDVGEIFSGIEQRFDVLSSLFERRQDDALEQGNMLFRELERRLNEVAERIDRRHAEAGLDSGSVMKVIDQRFAELAATLNTSRHDDATDEAIRGLETRLEGISQRLDQSASQFAGIDPELVRSLEAQVAGLSAHLSRPGAPLPEFVDISPRLKEIEKSIADSRESVIEAARAAAETAARSIAASQPETGAISGLAEEMKALDELTRRSDERNSKTFEAIHDTLLKIVDRMGSLEREAAGPARKLEVRDTPPIDAEGAFADDGDFMASAPLAETIVERTPAQAAAAAAMAALGAEHRGASETERSPGGVRSMFGGLARALGKKKETGPADAVQPAPAGEAPEVDLDAPLDPKLANRPLEPGSGAPDLQAIMRRVRDERAPATRAGETDAGKSDFIAAARRAAQAAAAEADVKKRKSDVGSPVKALRFGDMLKSRRKTILLVTTALLTGLAGLQVGKTLMTDRAEVASVGDATPTATAAAQNSAPAANERQAAADPLAARMVDAPVEAAIDSSAEHTASIGTAPEADPANEYPMDDVTVAAVSPVDPIATMPAPSLPIDVPTDAGPQALRDAAAAGDAKALFEVATRYAEGNGKQADMAAAAQWYEKAAEFGLAPAQYRIGNMYEKGIGVARDLAKSRDWYLQAAEKGNASAMHNLAVLYAMGADGQTDNDAAAEWFVKAAELGVKDSQFNLGILSAKGVGMPQNLEESYKWFALVAKTGDKDAASKRDEIAKALRPEQLERARAASELWKPKPLDAEANSVDVPAAWQTPGSQSAGGIDTPKAVQDALNKSGYDAGSADGVVGSKTKAAIAQFQMDNGMNATGEIDASLISALMARN